MGISENCLIHGVKESSAVQWTLHSAVEDARDHVGQLTEEEITYCLQKEKRVTVQKMLQSELKKREKAKK